MRRLLLLLLATATALTASAQQLTLNLALSPPYSPYFSDYLSIGNKALLTITNTGREVDVYFRGSITGDNGISGSTDPNFRPGAPNTIAAGPAPVILRGPDFERYFNFGNFQLRGITERELVTGSGLPEGNYTVCLQAFDYNTGQPVSNDACFVIPIVYPEAPVPMTPLCEGTVLPNRAQQITFTWAPSPGAPPRTRYVLRMAELVRPDQNPYDALNTLTTPPFFETETSIPTYTYRLSDPKLTEGRRYAWGITAFDPTRQTLFRNNGISPACVFTYGTADTAVPPPPPPFIGTNLTALSLLTPRCNPSDPRASDSLVLGTDEHSLLANWIWAFQLADTIAMKNAADSALGRDIVRYRVTLKPLQLEGPTRKPVSGKPDATFTRFVGDSAQALRLNAAEFAASGLRYNRWYAVTVDALDGKNESIAVTPKCDVRLVQPPRSADSVTITGVLAYRLEAGGALYPAGLVPVRVNVVANSAKVPQPIWKYNEYTATKTDSSGKFSVRISVTAANKGLRYVDVTHSSAYLAQRTQNLPLDSFITSKGAPGATKELKGGDVVSLGQVPVDAYTYDLTVRMTKGFPKYYFDTSSKNYTTKNVLIDTLTINPKIKVKTGIPVALYRKRKAADIPWNEASTQIIGTLGDGKGAILVAEGVTSIENAGKPTERTVVKFRNLLCNRTDLNAEDVYYIQALINGKKLPGGGGSSAKQYHNTGSSKNIGGGGAAPSYGSVAGGMKATMGAGSGGNGGLAATGLGTGGTVWDKEGAFFSNGTKPPYYTLGMPGANGEEDEEASLEAPEQMIAFPKPLLKPNVYHYSLDTTYRFISTKAPQSEVRGKMVYEWKVSAPGYKRPLGKAKFRVVVRHLYNGGLGYPKSDGGNCKVVLTQVSDAATGEFFHPGADGIVVGSGETDAAGNFTVRVVNYDQKGVISTNATVKTFKTECGGEAPATQNQGTALNPIEQLKDMWQPHEAAMGGGDIYSSGFNSLIFLNETGQGYNATGGPINGSTTGWMNGTNGAGFGVNGTSTAFYGAGYNAATNAGGGAGKKTIKGKSGPIAGEEEWADPVPEDETEELKKTVVERRFFIEWEEPWAKYYGDTASFVIQAFETGDLGTVTWRVKERTKPITAKLLRDSVGNNGKTYEVASSQELNNTQMVVFRYKDDYQSPALPEGEGTTKHPMKPLLANSMVQQSAAQPVEWILENSIPVSAGKKFNTSGRGLLEAVDYRIQIAADPSKTSTRTQEYVDRMSNAVVLRLDKARVQGRVLDYTTDKPLAGAAVNLRTAVTKDPNGDWVYKNITVYSDAQGYWEMTQGQSIGGKTVSFSPLQNIDIVATKSGYDTTKVPSGDKGPDMGEQKAYQIKMQPSSRITGRVMDEKGKAVAAYILRTSDSSIFSTPAAKSDGTPNEFSVPAPKGVQQKLVFIPVDPAYFDDTTLVTATKSIEAMGDIVLPKRLHRMRFHITRLDSTGQKIKPAGRFRITLNNDKSQANYIGDTTITFPPFANVSVNNYTAVITDDGGLGYIPQTLNISNPESRTYKDYYITMRKGGTISGIVTLGGKPVSGARVYVQQNAAVGTGGTSGNQQAAWNEMESVTDAGGAYKIRGLVSKYSGSGGDVYYTVHATLDSPGLLIPGAKATVTLKNGAATQNFDLAVMANASLASIWGFPVSVEGVQKTGNNSYKVSGLVDLGANGTQFSWLDSNTRMRFKDVAFKTVNGAGGKTVLEPVAEEVPLVQAGLKMKFKNRYNVALSADTVAASTKALTLSKFAGVNAAGISAFTRIVDNSYNYPSSYLDFSKTGEFYLARPTGNNGAFTTKVPAISNWNLSQFVTFNLADRAGKPLKFSFIGFPSTASPAGSSIDAQGRIHLDVTMKGKIPNAEPGEVAINIKDLVLDQNKIDATAGTYPLEAKLGDWTLSVPTWTVDPQKGGIYSNNAVIKTGVADLKMGRFNLRKDLFVLDSFMPGAGITLGGGTVPLEDIKGTATLVFDTKCGSDGGAHWRFNLTAPQGQPAATFSMGESGGNAKLGVDYLQLISYNDENIVVLSSNNPEVPIGNNPLIHWKPSSISPNKDFFVLNGPATFDVPRMPSMALTVDYTKQAGKLTPSLQAPPAFSFDGKGYVKYVNGSGKAQINSSAKTISFRGTVAEPGRMEPIPCTFTFGQGNPGTIILEKGKMVKLTDKASLQLLKDSVVDGVLVNGMKVGADKDWSTLRYTGLFKETGNAVLSGNDTMGFEVLGEITASSKNIKATDMPTPFGNMNLVFDFATGELTGTMRMDESKFGSWSFTGDCEVRAGKLGFLTMAAGQLNTGTLLVEGFGTFTSGLVLGAYNLDQPIINKTVQFSKDPTASCWLQDNANKFRGFYFTGGYDILNKSEGFDIGVASAYFHAMLGVEASLGVNIGTAYMLGVGAHGKVKAGASAITGTKITGELNGHLTAQADYKKDGYAVNGKANLDVAFEVCQYIPWPIDEEYCFDGEKGAGATFEYAKGSGAAFDFYLYNPGNFFQCKK